MLHFGGAHITLLYAYNKICLKKKLSLEVLLIYIEARIEGTHAAEKAGRPINGKFINHRTRVKTHFRKPDAADVS